MKDSINFKESIKNLKNLINETKYYVYSPSEEQEELKTTGKSVYRSRYDAKDIRNIMMSYFMHVNFKDMEEAIRYYIDKMPDEWVVDFLRNQEDTVVEIINESVEPKQVSNSVTITVDRKEIHSLLSFCSMLINALAGDYVTKYTAEKYSKIIDKLDDQITKT